MGAHQSALSKAISTEYFLICEPALLSQTSPLPAPPQTVPWPLVWSSWTTFYLSTWPWKLTHLCNAKRVQQAIPSLSLLPTSSSSFFCLLREVKRTAVNLCLKHFLLLATSWRYHSQSLPEVLWEQPLLLKTEKSQNILNDWIAYDIAPLIDDSGVRVGMRGETSAVVSIWDGSWIRPSLHKSQEQGLTQIEGGFPKAFPLEYANLELFLQISDNTTNSDQQKKYSSKSCYTYLKRHLT